MHCVSKKSMDDEGLRFQIINLLKSAGASSSGSDLNNAVMNMLKILPPPVVKLKLEECLPANSGLWWDQVPYSPLAYDFTLIER